MGYESDIGSTKRMMEKEKKDKTKKAVLVHQLVGLQEAVEKCKIGIKERDSKLEAKDVKIRELEKKLEYLESSKNTYGMMPEMGNMGEPVPPYEKCI